MRHLSSLSRDEMWGEASGSTFPKWGMMCLLKYLDIPVLDAIFLAPTTDPSVAEKAVKKFALTHNQERVLIRTDGGVESGDYMRGGNSPTLNRATEIIPSILAEGRAAVVTIPTNRFDNRLAVNLALDSSGYFRIEIAGPGFDVSDLNRGLIIPESIAYATEVNWCEFEKPVFPLCSIESPDADFNRQRQIRLQRTATELLPRYGATQDPEDTRPPEVWAEEWLRRHGNTGLFEKERPTLSLLDVQKYYEDAFLIGLAYREISTWKNLSISLSDLGKPHGVVYWDIVDPSDKFR